MKMRRLNRSWSINIFILTVLFVCLFFLFARPAWAKDYRYPTWDVDITVNDDSTLDVVENITYSFDGQFYGTYRTINYGDNVLSIDDLMVSEDGQEFSSGYVAKGQITTPGQYQVFDDPASKTINFSINALNQERTFSISYKVVGGFYYYEKVDDLIWPAISEDRDKPIDDVVVTVHLPKELSLKDDQIGLDTNARSSSKDAIDSQTVVFRGSDLGPNSRFRVGIKMPKGTVQVNQELFAKQKEREADLQSLRIVLPVVLGISFLLVVGVFVLMLLLWWKWGRDTAYPKVAEYITEPPDNTPPAIVSKVMTERTDMDDINATVIDLARRGYVKIWDKPDDTMFEWLGDKGDLKPYELQLISGLFGGGQTVNLSTLKNKFYQNVPKIKKMIGKEAVAGGFYKATPAKIRLRYVGLGIAFGVVGAFIAFFLSAAVSSVFAAEFPFYDSILTFALPTAVAVSGLIIIVFGFFMPQKTPLGAEAKVKWDSFRDYLKDIKKYDRLDWAQEIFEQYLPYAVAFGLERVFTSAFSEQEVIPPIWFSPYWFPGYPDQGWARDTWTREHPGEVMPTSTDRSTGGLGDFSLDSMSTSLFATLNTMSDTLISAPSSSGSGTSFGGGSFGGSSGGGGGSGAW